MAEADAVVLSALQQSACVDASEDVSSWAIRELSFEVLAPIVHQCLLRIQEADEGSDFGLPERFEPARGVAARHRLGSKLAGLLKELGYAGDCGYNHFLYPNEKETRSILSWLVGKLPRAKSEEELKLPEVHTHKEVVNSKHQVDELLEDYDESMLTTSSLSVASIFTAWKQERTLHFLPNRHVRDLRGHQRLPIVTAPVILPWTHADSNQRGKMLAGLFDGFPNDALRVASLLEAVSATTSLSNRSSELVDNGILPVDNNKEFLKQANAAMLQRHSSQPRVLLSSKKVKRRSSYRTDVHDGTSILSRAEGTTQDEDKPTNDDVQNEEAVTRVDSATAIEELQSQSEKTQRRITAMKKVIAKDRSRLQETQQHVADLEISKPALEKTLAAEKKLLSMLPAAEENVAKLEALCKKTQQKLDELAGEWEQTRGPLLREQEELIANMSESGAQARGRQLIADMKTFRSEMYEIAESIEEKTQALAALEKAYATARSSNKNQQTRNSYTARIMDIIKQVHKQKQDIAKIIDDITLVQKQLNVSAEKLKRSEAIAEDKLFSAATKKLQSNNSSSGLALGVGFSAGKEPAANTAAYIDCYRKFTQVRELFEDLLGVIGDVGKKENGVRDLMNWIAQLEARDSSRHIDKVRADLDAVRLENAALNEQLRGGNTP